MADKRIKDLTNTATEEDLVAGNYFALDVSAGTKKLNSTTLLELTAQNAFEYSSELAVQQPLFETEVVQNKYINASGETASSSSFELVTYDVTGLSKIYVLVAMGNVGRLAFFNASSQIVGSLVPSPAPTTSQSTLAVDVPDGAEIVKVSNYTASGSAMVFARSNEVIKEVEKVKDKLNIPAEKVNADTKKFVLVDESNVSRYGKEKDVAEVLGRNGSVEISANKIVAKNIDLSFLGVTVNGSSGAEYTISGTSTGSGGRTNHLTDFFELPAGDYYIYPQPLNAEAAEKYSSVTAFVMTASDTIQSVLINRFAKFTLAASTNITLGFNVSNGVTFTSCKVGLVISKDAPVWYVSPEKYYFIDKGKRSDFENGFPLYYGGRFEVKNDTLQGATISLTPTNNTSYSCSLVKVNKGEVFKVSAKITTVYRSWSFVDEQCKLVLKASVGPITLDGYILVAPVDGYMLINTMKSSGLSITRLGYEDDVFFASRQEKENREFVMSRAYTPYYANAKNKLNLINYLGNVDNIHPKVLYFEAGLYGHKFWMAYTPYPNMDATTENPCIAYSDDGRLWYGIAGNPLDSNPTIDGELAYNSDTHLVYNGSRLECWWRTYSSAGQPSKAITYRMVSTDGITWSGKEALHTVDSTGKDLSPAVIFKDYTYHIWTVNSLTDVIEYYTSSDGTDWQFVGTIDLPLTFEEEAFNPWHLDVEFMDNKFYFVINAKSKTTTRWIVFLASSSLANGSDCSVPCAVVLNNPNSWDFQLYRSCIVKVGAEYMIFYSARRSESQGIGITVAKTLYEFFGEDTIY